MDHEKKLSFVHAMTKLGLKHYDGGGVISAGNSNPLSGISGALTAQNPYNAGAPTSTGTIGQQQATLAGQLQNEAAGNGPNPAQDQYLQNANEIAQEQATNYAQNRALNPGLAARMAGNTGANIQQKAAGTAGIQQAEQQLAAQREMGALTGQEQQGALQAQGINAQVSQNNANSVNNMEGNIVGGVASGIGGAMGKLFHHGGEVEKMADGGSVHVPGVADFSNADLFNGSDNSNADSMGSSAGKWMAGKIMSPGLSGTSASGPALAGGAETAAELAPMAALAAKGGMMHKGPSSLLGMFAHGMKPDQVLMRMGGNVRAVAPVQKALKKDDSVKNDRIPAMLSEGEIVIPRHITQHPKAPEKAAAFVSAVLNKKRMGAK